MQNQISENDIYAIEGWAGQVLSIEIFSQTLENLQGNMIDPVVRLYDQAGQLVAYFDGVAVNDDQFEGSESRLIDVRLPSNGIYYIEVDTFRRSSEDPFCHDLVAHEGELHDRLLAACTDQDTGGYELLVYSFETYSPEDGIDTLLGRGGVDVLDGGRSDSYVLKVDMPAVISAEEGTSFSLAGVIEDRGGHFWMGRVNYGDGTGWHQWSLNGSRSFSIVHSYPDNGTYFVTVEVQNDDLLPGMATTMVQVVNVAPIIGPIIAPVQPVAVFTLVSTEFSFTDAGRSILMSCSGTGETGPCLRARLLAPMAAIWLEVAIAMHVPEFID